MSGRGILIVVSGFSGAGKGTLMNRLMNQYSDYALSISATTRKPREGELDGREYFFIDKEKFSRMIEAGELYEYAQYQDNYYGTPKAYVDEQLENGKDVILEIEVQGAAKIKGRFPDTVLIFVTPPSAPELRRRLIGRGTETVEKVEGRLRRACEEAAYMESYDYILVNDDLDRAVHELHAMICTEHKRSSRCSDFNKKMKTELLEVTKGEAAL